MSQDNGNRRNEMTPGERCDEIMRLIDETLDDYATSRNEVRSPGAGDDAEKPLVAAVRTLARAQAGQLPRSA